MFNKLERYANADIVEHLAERYALGLVSEKVRARVDTLIQSDANIKLREAVKQYQSLLQPLDEAIPEVTPDNAVWEKLQVSISSTAVIETNDNVIQLPTSQPRHRQWLPLAASFMLVALLAIFVTPQIISNQAPALSYIAVMTNENDEAALVAATYGDSRELTLDLVNLPTIEADSSYELWVTSKTDKQARSLGLISLDNNAMTRQLSEAEWRLIKDSATLIVTVEEYGGSAIGEPMGEVIAEGLCVRLSAWEA